MRVFVPVSAWMRLFVVPSDAENKVVLRAGLIALTSTVPSSCRYQELKFVPVMLATSALRVAAAVVVGMYEVGKAPASSWALVTLPVTVSVNVPADGVNVNVVRAFDSVPDARAFVIRADSARPETIAEMKKETHYGLLQGSLAMKVI